MTMGQISVVLADDHPGFLLGVRYGLEAEGLAVVAWASDGAAAIEACRRHRPAAAVLDIRMPTMDGLAAMQVIHDELPDTALIALSTYDDAMTKVEARRSGARAYLTKDAAIREIADAVRRLVLEPRLVLIDVPVLPTLTSRELQVLVCLCDGWSNKQIARHLGVAVDTVKDHCSTLYGKLSAHGRSHAVSIAMDLGLLDRSPPSG